jgi:hypothetical protein
MGETPARGLDETRRLLYMALVCRSSAGEKYELIGTLVNALAHHHPDGTSAAEIQDHLEGAIENGTPVELVWIRRQIQRLTEEMGGNTNA